MSGLVDMLRSLIGGGGSTYEPAPPLANYPTPEDAANAKKYGFGYGDPAVDRTSARMMTGRTEGRTSTELARGAVDDTQSKNVSPAPEGIADVLTRAALAANRIPIAGLGYDPSRMAADPKTYEGVNLAGSYEPTADGMYYNRSKGRDPSTPVHESIHRGLQMLRQDPANAEFFKNLPGEETVVRYLMATQAGDPENGTGEIGQQQRDFALSLMKGDGGMYSKPIASLTSAAQQAIAKRKPGGPR